MKLYKFRSLEDCEYLERVKSIIENGKFWCSKFSELNDPMEGSYTAMGVSSDIIHEIYQGKKGYRICSFSGEGAIDDPSLWGYYANGFRGCVIELSVSPQKRRYIQGVTYDNHIPVITGTNNTPNIEKILTFKLSSWCREREYRYLIENQDSEHTLGKISKVYIGRPYQRADNRKHIIADSEILSKHEVFSAELIKHIRKINKDKSEENKIEIHYAWTGLQAVETEKISS